MNNLALYVIFLCVCFVENQRVRRVFRNRHNANHRHHVPAYPRPSDPLKDSTGPAPEHSHLVKHISAASSVPPDPVKHTSWASAAPPDPVKHSGVEVPVHSDPLTHSGGAAPVHSHPERHSSVSSHVPPDPVKHSGVAEPVHSSPRNGKAISPKSYTTPQKTIEPLKQKAPPQPKYLINWRQNTQPSNPIPTITQQAHHQPANLPAILDAVDHLSYFQDRALPDSFGLIRSDKLLILKEFNQFRQDCEETQNMNVLRWNETLAERAAAEINSCLYFNKGNGAIYAMIYEKHTGTSLISEAVSRWANEKNRFRLKAPCNETKSCRYSQIVWADTKEVGCARQTCNDMSMVACMYHPPGNVIGGKAYQPGRPCSNCEPGSKCNSDQLCEW